MRFKLLACAALGLLLQAVPAAAKTSGDLAQMKAGPAHQLITQEKGWLNTTRPLTAEDLKGRIILLDFWTYCCVNCLHTLPDLAELEAQFGDKLTVIGVHSAKFSNEGQTGNIRDAIIRYEVAHPVVNDADFRIWKGFGVHAWPTLKLINPNGAVVSSYSGENHLPELQRDIRALMVKFPQARSDALPLALEKDKMPPSLLQFPAGLAAGMLDGRELLFIADTGHHRILASTRDGEILSIIGSGESGNREGSFATAQFASPQGLTYRDGKLYIADTGNHLLRVADMQTQTVATLAGTGKKARSSPKSAVRAQRVALASPWDVAFYPDDKHLAIAMTGRQQLWVYDLEQKTVSVLAGSGGENIKDGPAQEAQLAQPSGLAVMDGMLYFVDAETSSLRLLKGGRVYTLIGTGLFDFGFRDGDKATARMQHPLAVEAFDGAMYVADSYNHALRRYDLKTWQLITVIGNGDRLKEPGALLAWGDTLYIADTNHHRIVTLAGQDIKPFPLTFAASPIAYSEALPNVQAVPPLNVRQGAALTLTLGLPQGWHVNEDAPSYLALFTGDATHTPIAQFDTGQLQPHVITLPALAAGPYRLQAVLYYCKDDDTSGQCLIAGFDVTLEAAQSGETTLALPVALPES